MRPQHSETLRRLRGRMTSLVNRAARRPPDIQSRLDTRGDRTCCLELFESAIAEANARTIDVENRSHNKIRISEQIGEAQEECEPKTASRPAARIRDSSK